MLMPKKITASLLYNKYTFALSCLPAKSMLKKQDQDFKIEI